MRLAGGADYLPLVRHTPRRRAAAFLLELLLVALVVIGGGGDCRAMHDVAHRAHVAHASHGSAPAGEAPPVPHLHGHDAHGHDAQGHDATGHDAHGMPGCPMAAICAPELAAGNAPSLAAPVDVPVAMMASAASDAPASVVRAVEPPPPRV